MIDSYQFMRLSVQVRLDYAQDMLIEETTIPNKRLFKVKKILDFKNEKQKTIVKEYIKERKWVKSLKIKDLERIEKSNQRAREAIRSEQEYKLEYFKARQMNRARREIAKQLKRAGFHVEYHLKRKRTTWNKRTFVEE